MRMQADYVVVGAGSAGCVVATRLSETGASCLLEAGPSDWHPMIHIPAGVRSCCTIRWSTGTTRTEPEPGIARPAHPLAARQACSAARARSTACSMSAAIRPITTAGRRWAAAAGASTTCCRISASRSTTRRATPRAPRQGRPAAGRGLPHHPAADPSLRRSRAAGRLSRSAKDLNGAQQEGVGYSQMTRNGRFRGSTARTFLARGARPRRTCAIETKALATRLLFEGKRCVGVAFRQGGRDREVARRARGDPVAAAPSTRRICCRSPASARPRICNRSASRWCTICRASAPTCPDHYVARVSHRVQGRGLDQPAVAHGVRLAGEVVRFAVDRARRADLRRHQRAGVLPASREGLASPDLQLLFTPASYDPLQVRRARARARHDGGGLLGPARQPRHDHGEVAPIRSSSRRSGRTTCRRADDLRVLIAGIAPHARASSPLRRWRQHSVAETMPGPERRTATRELADYMPPATAPRIFHPVGTCRMGEDPMRRGRSAPARARHRRPAGDRRLGHADADHRQHQRARPS